MKYSFVFQVDNQEQIPAEKSNSNSKKHHENKRFNKKHSTASKTMDEHGKYYFI